MSSNNEELTVEDLDKLVASQNEVAEQTEDENENPDNTENNKFSSTNIDKILRIATELADHMLENDRHMERVLRCKRGRQDLVLQYEEARKEFENRRHRYNYVKAS
ncbi:hypothetical protein J6590_006350 [Homalodisca vitripennis]|nr:hypothetical protein J6590_006350 [Homalodisca vitripennis]